MTGAPPSHPTCNAHEAEVRRIAKMEETLASLGLSVTAVRDSLSETWDTVCDLRPMIEKTGHAVDEMRLALLGDLLDHKGLITRVREVESRQSTMWVRIDEIAEIVGGDKTAGKPGVTERLRVLEHLADRVSRVGWIILAAMIGQSATIVVAIGSYFLFGR